SSSRANDQASELVSNGGKALNTLKQDIRQAGFRGRTWGEPEISVGWVGPATGCAGAEPGASAGAFASNIRQGVWGANNGNPFSANCIPPGQYVPGTDVLVIRYLSTMATPVPVADAVYLRSSYGRGELFRGATEPTDAPDATAATDFAVRIHVYHVRPYTRSADENPRSPALVRSSLQSDGTMRTELVTGGIEQFQVQYGRLGFDANTQYVDTLAGDSSTPTPTEWDDVHSMRIWLLARSSTAESGYLNSAHKETPVRSQVSSNPLGGPGEARVGGAQYVMGDRTVQASNDGYHRQLFSSVVQLRNGSL
ncbi:MAG: PilW family protein, partial [Burkholderiaceae bacterium]